MMYYPCRSCPKADTCQPDGDAINCDTLGEYIDIIDSVSFDDDYDLAP